MKRFDITQTNVAVERLIETTTNPRHLYLLHTYNRHRYLDGRAFRGNLRPRHDCGQAGLPLQRARDDHHP